MPALIVVLIVFFSILRPTTFATAANASTILLQNAVLVILALAAVLPLIVNEFDLSVASVMGLAAMLTAGLPTLQGLPVPVVITLVLTMGALVGALHALLIVGFGLPSFIVTLGTSSLLGGMILLYSGSSVIFQQLPPALTWLGVGKVVGIGVPIIVMAIVAIVLWFVLEQRPVGRKLYAVGANAQAARLAGVNVGALKSMTLIVTGILAALAGLILTAQTGSASPTTYSAYFLPAFAGAFLSLAAFRIGRYNPIGVVASVYLLAIGISGLGMLGAPSWINPVFNGIALVVAVGISRLFGRSRGRG